MERFAILPYSHRYRCPPPLLLRFWVAARLFVFWPVVDVGREEGRGEDVQPAKRRLPTQPAATRRKDRGLQQRVGTRHPDFEARARG